MLRLLEIMKVINFSIENTTRINIGCDWRFSYLNDGTAFKFLSLKTRKIIKGKLKEIKNVRTKFKENKRKISR